MLLNYTNGAKLNNAITNNDKKTTTKDNFFVSSCPWISFEFCSTVYLLWFQKTRPLVKPDFNDDQNFVM